MSYSFTLTVCSVLALSTSAVLGEGLTFAPSEVLNSGSGIGLRAPVLDANDLGLGMLAEPPVATPAVGESGWRQQSWLMPAVNVEGQAHSGLREEDRIGSYGQPRWTATRRFPSTRVYVIPEGHVEVEGWARATMLRSDQGGETEWRFLQEVEIGLPNRFQLDLYLRQDTDTASDKLLWGGQFEVRYALADWGKIWGNPTLYFEYLTLEDRPDKIEPKLLLGDEICEGWHWAVNFIAEIELSDTREHEWSVTGALSNTVIDEKLSLGVECVFPAQWDPKLGIHVT